jgi:hypothetical protein
MLAGRKILCGDCGVFEGFLRKSVGQNVVFWWCKRRELRGKRGEVAPRF